VDGSSYTAIPYGTALPDVCAQLPDVAACPRIGFAVNFDTTRSSNGPHVLGVLLRKGGINVFVDNP
jgi:hypothetical protein